MPVRCPGTFPGSRYSLDQELSQFKRPKLKQQRQRKKPVIRSLATFGAREQPAGVKQKTSALTNARKRREH